MLNIKNIKLNIPKFLRYSLGIIWSLFYAIYFATNFSLSLMIILLITPMISVVFTILAISKFDLKINISTNTAGKNEHIILKVDIISDSFIPLPFLNIKLFAGNKLENKENDIYSIYVSNNEDGRIRKNYVTKIWGKDFLGVSSITTKDLLGLFEFTILNEETVIDKYRKTIHISPDFADTKDRELLSSIYMNSNESDEDESEATTADFMSTPGYEHRDYVPGDSLKRINWKLSAKLDKHMVREFEPVGNTKPVFLLDYLGLFNRHMLQKIPTDKAKQELAKDIHLIEERIIESLLGVMTSMLNQGIPCSVFYNMAGEWTSTEILSENDLFQLQFNLGSYEFKEPTNTHDEFRIPDIAVGPSGITSSLVVFTANFNNQLFKELSNSPSNSTPYVVSSNPSNVQYGNLWVINENYEITKNGGGLR